MPSGEHTHYEKYLTRVIWIDGTEFIEFICEEDGEVFRRVKVRS